MENKVLLSEIIKSLDFKIDVEKGLIKLVDLKSANLGGIEKERWCLNASLSTDLLERLDAYINDYYIVELKEQLLADVNITEPEVDTYCLEDLINVYDEWASPETKGFLGDLKIERAIANPDNIVIDDWIVDEVEKQLGQIAYSEFKIFWMDAKSIGVDETFKLADVYRDACIRGEFKGSFEDYVETYGYYGEIWPCFDEFMSNEFKDKDFVEKLTEDVCLYSTGHKHDEWFRVTAIDFCHAFHDFIDFKEKMASYEVEKLISSAEERAKEIGAEDKNNKHNDLELM